MGGGAATAPRVTQTRFPSAWNRDGRCSSQTDCAIFYGRASRPKSRLRAAPAVVTIPCASCSPKSDQRQGNPMSTASFDLAMGQMLVQPGELRSNLRRARRMIAEAAEGKCRMVVLPECLDLGWTHMAAHLQGRGYGGSCRLVHPHTTIVWRECPLSTGRNGYAHPIRYNVASLAQHSVLATSPGHTPSL